MGRGPASRIEGLELARFAFAFAVLAYHYLYRGPITGRVDAAPGPSWLIYGRFAVEAFFVISGYVIARSAQKTGALDFAISRIGRLWPALVICAALTAGVVYVAQGVVVPAAALAKAALFAPMLMTERMGMVDSSYWSISIELRFYLVIALLLLAFRRLPNLDVFAAIWLGASAVAVFVPAWGPSTLSPYSAYFIFGLLLFRREGGSRIALWLMPPTFVLAGWQTFTDYARLQPDAHWQAGYGIAAVIFAITSLMRRPIPGRLSPLLTTLGAMTYPLYLIHQRAGYALIDSAKPYLGHGGAVALATVAALATAWVISRFLEGPLRRGVETALRRLAGALPPRLREWVAGPARGPDTRPA